MPLVPAKCPECGGLVEVNNEKRAAICQHCGEAFTIEDAVQNFNTYYNTTNKYNTTTNNTHNYGDGAVVNVYEDRNKDFVIEAGVLKEYHGESVDVILPDNVMEIDINAFKGMKIRKLTITSNIQVSNIDDVLCNNQILDFSVTKSATDYYIENDAVYGQNGEVIIWINNSDEISEFIIPLNVNRFSKKAMYQMGHLEHLIYNDLDLMNISCWDKNNILKYKDKFIVKLKHSYKNGRCVYCKEFDMSNCTNINLPLGIRLHMFDDLKCVKLISPNINIEQFNLNSIEASIICKCKKTRILYLSVKDLNYTVNESKQVEGLNRLLALFPNVEELIFLKFSTSNIIPKMNIYNYDKVCFEDNEISKATKKEFFSKLESLKIEEQFKKKEQHEIDKNFEATMKLFEKKDQAERWKNEGKCKFCGGELKQKLFSKKCKKCGMLN